MMDFMMERKREREGDVFMGFKPLEMVMSWEFSL